jgi:hypothetical protein
MTNDGVGCPERSTSGLASRYSFALYFWRDTDKTGKALFHIGNPFVVA